MTVEHEFRRSQQQGWKLDFSIHRGGFEQHVEGVRKMGFRVMSRPRLKQKQRETNN